MADDIQKLIFQLLDDSISAADFDRLQAAIEHDERAREAYLQAVGLTESLGEVAVESHAEATPEASAESKFEAKSNASPARWSLLQLALAASLLMAVGAGAFWAGTWNRTAESGVGLAASLETTEARIAGHATLRRAVSLKWPQGAVRRLEGDVLPNGIFAFEEGVAEIDFFCGATVIVEGPAKLDIESDWSVQVTRGRLRANVPPAAQGFVVKAADSEIIDLGTEFALEVGEESVRVAVIDGEVKLRGGQHDGKHLTTGEGASLKGTANDKQLVDQLSTIAEFDQRRRQAQSERFQQWKSVSQRLESDKRLIAYFPISAGFSGRSVPNKAAAAMAFDGQLVGPVEREQGRLGPKSTGLDFDRPGSRVRTKVDGEFQAFTFVCWVRIDGLDHRYNALFMGDSYDNGEPHWQIRDDGRLMFSVMVDDTQEIQHFSEIDQKMVSQAGLHRVYYTPPFWDSSKSGHWFHLAAVYDPAGRRVKQYVNGDIVANQEIADKFHIQRLRIGAAELGNWGQPFRKSPWFAVRNLNGTMDELAIFDAALGDDEIRQLYEEGKPIGY